MRTLRKITYLILGLSLLPILVTFFAYGGKPLEIVHFFSALIFLIGLAVLFFSKSKSVIMGVLIFGIITFLFQLTTLNDLWFNNEGGDIRVPIAFSVQAFVMLVALFFIWSEKKYVSKI